METSTISRLSGSSQSESCGSDQPSRIDVHAPYLVALEPLVSPHLFMPVDNCFLGNVSEEKISIGRPMSSLFCLLVTWTSKYMPSPYPILRTGDVVLNVPPARFGFGTCAYKYSSHDGEANRKPGIKSFPYLDMYADVEQVPDES